MSGNFQFAVRLHSELEAKMISVERIQYYEEKVPHEDTWESRDSEPSLDWPKFGRISFRDARLRYRMNVPLALKGVSFDIKGSEKVGIVGRTGSGKSSIASALFRLYELCGGSVSVDGTDVSDVGLHVLRRRMAAIPQDPALFAGTVRFNLDPMRRHDDDRLWDALQKTHLKNLVSEMDLGLDTLITEGGSNISTGERQLVCLARALLRNVTILVLDEATSNVDAQTDEQIQSVLREHFRDVTVLVIAHRLESILHSDKILFMDDGQVIEFDEPRVLLGDPKSRFFQIVQQNSSSAYHGRPRPPQYSLGSSDPASARLSVNV